MSNTDTTDDVDVRHRLTNDGLAYVLVVSNVVLLVGALWLGVEVPALLWRVFALSVALAATWAFGKGALKAILGAVQNDGGGES
jgi:uncharacterized protein (DUF983 family)